MLCCRALNQRDHTEEILPSKFLATVDEDPGQKGPEVSRDTRTTELIVEISTANWTCCDQ